MKKLFPLVITLLVAACNQKTSMSSMPAAGNMDSLRASLMNADKAWNDASLKKGYAHSRVDFAADEGIELEPNEMPLVGKQAMNDYAAGHPDTAQTSQWMATKAEVAASGDLGYTYGAYSLKMKTKRGTDTTEYGTYVTVWKKQSDGSWKFVADASVESPQQVK